MNRKGLGKLQRKLLKFAKKYPNHWHSYKQNRDTKRRVLSLVKRRLIKLNTFSQFKLA